jgi:hypothetical protein
MGVVDQRCGRVHDEPRVVQTQGHGGALIGVGPPATPGHRSSLAGAEKREGSTGVPLRASPELRRRCGDRTTTMKWWRWRISAAGALKLRGRGKDEGKVR